MRSPQKKKPVKTKKIKLKNYESKISHVKSCIKDHKCSWCHKSIFTGSEFYKYVMSFDDSHEQVKLHPECYREVIEERDARFHIDK